MTDYLPTISTLNCAGQLLSLDRPVIMGILNVTPDSFYDGGRYNDMSVALQRCEQMLVEGAAIIDIGGMSSRPGSHRISTDEELRRVIPTIEAVHQRFSDAIISIDTVHARVARAAVAAGATIINDISAGRMDDKMHPAVAELKVPYVLMHMQGTPDHMQQDPQYGDVVVDVMDFLLEQIKKLRALGVKDIIIDPGFGFGKRVEDNFALLAQLHQFRALGMPILAGISRKSMVSKVLRIKSAEALNGTTALHMIALQQGAQLLRVHDVLEARQVIDLWQQLQASGL